LDSGSGYTAEENARYTPFLRCFERFFAGMISALIQNNMYFPRIFFLQKIEVFDDGITVNRLKSHNSPTGKPLV
jgi:hypothetical protein